MSAPPSLSLQKTTVALVQLGATSFDKTFNLERARDAVLKAAQGPASPAADAPVGMVVLPECFNSPYGVKYFSDYAESFGGAYQRIKKPLPSALPRMGRGKEEIRWTIDSSLPEVDSKLAREKGVGRPVQIDDHIAKLSPSLKMLSETAKAARIVLVGGSVPERDDLTGNIYNTSCVFNEEGDLISMHRKLHLFDIDIPGKMTFQESETLSGGDRVTLFDCSLGRFGLGICYDLRFPEPAIIASRLGAGCMLYPGAFNTTTGPVSWELLMRARATDNQMYVAGCSPARPSSAALEGTLSEKDGWKSGEKAYPAWGHSTFVGPLGDVKAKLEELEDTVFFTLDPEEVVQVRKNIPISTQRRFDVYPDVTCG
ncbi:carbon-nitrogen hydrolase [Testicularia cyperi]|uniref:Carbon-nitrogen hydrolase n=1 Tax=Testicularia cyperi TaxID=1882483 RepID=A0A317XPN2_9BASI|nr:carbon-nitrogen hydrolase [Testicularia cyperi]